MRDFRYGLSENPPTIKMKSTPDFKSSAYPINSATLSSIFSKSGSKKLFINVSGSSTPEAPLAFNYYSFGLPSL
jgi:hypothetical protein